MASSSGGVWKTTNRGVTYQPVFDGEGSYSIGCVTLDPSNSTTVWVGSGENNSQRSVAYGDGVYKSMDGGNSWKNMGLKILNIFLRSLSIRKIRIPFMWELMVRYGVKEANVACINQLMAVRRGLV